MALREGTSDLAILIPPLPDDAGLYTRPFDEDRLAIALLIAHPLAKQNSVTLSDLANEPFVMRPAAEGRGFHHRVIQLCTAAGFVSQVVQEAYQMHGVLALVAVEIGVSVVPASMTGFRAEEIAYCPLNADDTSFTLFLCNRNEPPSATAQNFIDAI